MAGTTKAGTGYICDVVVTRHLCSLDAASSAALMQSDRRRVLFCWYTARWAVTGFGVERGPKRASQNCGAGRREPAWLSSFCAAAGCRVSTRARDTVEWNVDRQAVRGSNFDTLWEPAGREETRDGSWVRNLLTCYSVQYCSCLINFYSVPRPRRAGVECRYVMTLRLTDCSDPTLFIFHSRQTCESLRAVNEVKCS